MTPSPRIAIKQRGAFLRLRDVLLTELKGAGITGVKETRKVLQAFDHLPYRAPPIESTWLPSEEELACSNRGVNAHLETAGASSAVLQRLVQAAEAETEHLRVAVAAAEESDEPQISLLDNGWGTHNVVLPQRRAKNQTKKKKTKPRNERASSYERGNERASFSVSSSRLQWLRRTHAAVASVAGGAPVSEAAREALFRRHLFCMLARYDAFAGGTGPMPLCCTSCRLAAFDPRDTRLIPVLYSGGAGNQAAVPPDVFTGFTSWAGAGEDSVIEAFASPLNHRLGDHGARGARTAETMKKEKTKEKTNVAGAGTAAETKSGGDQGGRSAPFYCSAFPDVDQPFGAVSSFLSLPSLRSLSSIPSRSAAEPPPPLLLLANPPFLPWLMHDFVPNLQRLMQAEDAPPTVSPSGSNRRWLAALSSPSLCFS